MEKLTLHNLAREGDDKKLNAVLDNHENSYVDFDTRDSNNLTALQCAVIWDKPHVLSVLLHDERTESARQVRDSEGLSLAHYAAKTVRGNINPGICIDGSVVHRDSGEEGRSCLKVIIDSDKEQKRKWRKKSGRKRLTLEEDAEKREEKLLMYSRDLGGQSPMHYAVMSGNKHAVELLNDNDDTSNAATDSRHEKTAEWQDDKKKLIYSADRHGMTPLHVAAKYGQVTIATYLLDKDASSLSLDGDNSTPLHYSAAAGNLDMTNLFLERTENVTELVNQKDKEGNTALHLSAENGHEKVANILLSKGIDVKLTQARNDGMWPVHLAAASGKLSIVEELTSQPEDFNRTNRHNSTALHIAAQYNRCDVANYILQQKDGSLGRKDKDGNTALHIAARYGHTKLVRSLMDRGADISSTNVQRQIPLHAAAEHGHMDTFNVLLTPSNPTNSSESLKVDVETKKKIVELLESLVGAGDPQEKEKIIGSISEVLQILLSSKKQSGVNDVTRQKAAQLIQTLVDVKDTKEKERLIKRISEVLQEAPGVLTLDEDDAGKRFQHIVTMVVDVKRWKSRAAKTPQDNGVESGSNLANERNVRRQSKGTNSVQPLNGGSRGGSAPVAPYESLLGLLHAHIWINSEDQKGNTPLHLAASSGQEDIVTCILRNYSVVPNRKNNSERTALHLAAIKGNTRSAEVIVKGSGNAVFAEDQGGNTPLHLAAQGRHKDTVQLLLLHGADTKHMNASGHNVLDLAASSGCEETCNILIRFDSHAKEDLHHKTSPLNLACKNGHLRVVKLLLENDGDVNVKDERGLNCLDLAVDNKHRDVARHIIRSTQWKDALKNSVKASKGSCTCELSCACVKKSKNRVDTPMRRLIKKMPDVAYEVLDKCIDSTSTSKQPLSDYQFIDDLYESWISTDNPKDSDGKMSKEKQKKKKNKDLTPYTKKARTIKKNHPLKIMVKYGRDELLQHPLVRNLITTMWWQFGLYYYLATALFHTFFLLLLSRVVLMSKPPHEYLSYEIESVRSDSCRSVIDQTDLSDWLVAEKGIMYALMVIGVIFEILQIYTSRSAYFTSLENYVEWVVFILSFLFLLDFNLCYAYTGFREEWQWSLGAFALFFSWIDLVLYLKAFTSLGLYVIMFQLVCWTFLKVFVVFFCLLAAFALGFHTLLQNQIPFRDVANSILRTSVMFIGEIDYNDIFNAGVNATGDEYGKDNNLIYPTATSVMFSTFILLACIVLMNLLVGLAVDDIKGITREATFKRTSMHVDMVLDVETVLYKSHRQKCYRKRRKCVAKDKVKQRGFWHWLKHLPIWWWNQQVETDENAILKCIPELIKRQEELHELLLGMNKELLAQNRRMEKFLQVKGDAEKAESSHNAELEKEANSLTLHHA
ncbi:transient receptor potential cation channel subfamily A member 1 homolog isoform X2 [Haliotis rufescens]|uniref:transient receptor potential cation channel subfamily A member 1 homolog isoform X2 n=1 Tax=Haliotis rufescens TaxID=6454 RepID=UPI00201FB296|nr:transient receptor potential cation channel subfamily A member 1 homolog isoform X2 [Haliotis rufescens]